MAEVIRQHCAGHARETPVSACEEAIRPRSIEPVVQRFITQPVFA